MGQRLNDKKHLYIYLTNNQERDSFTAFFLYTPSEVVLLLFLPPLFYSYSFHFSPFFLEFVLFPQLFQVFINSLSFIASQEYLLASFSKLFHFCALEWLLFVNMNVKISWDVPNLTVTLLLYFDYFYF